MRQARPYLWRFMLGLRRPRRRTLELEFAGVVGEVGGAVTSFEVGDRVFGLWSGSPSAYVCVREGEDRQHRLTASSSPQTAPRARR